MSATLPKFAGAIPGRHLGRLRPPASMLRRILPLAPFVKRYGAKPPPDTVDYRDKAPRALAATLANDQWGDCTIAAALHGLTLARAVVPGGSDQPATDSEAVSQYHAICGRGDPGCYIPHVLDALRDKGLTAAGRKSQADGYASLASGDQLLAKICVYLLGGLHLGVNLPRAWYERANDSDVWDVTTSDVVGGHSVQVVGYEPRGLRVSTWGKTPLLTWAAFSDPRWIEERYAILHQDWYTKEGLTAHGVNVQALKDALDAIHRGEDPVIPDPNPPVPPVPPVPPSPPVPPNPNPWTWEHTWTLQTFLGALKVHLGVLLGASEHARRTVDWWQLAKDVYALAKALYAHDWTAATTAALAILADLGMRVDKATGEALEGVMRGMDIYGVILPQRLLTAHVGEAEHAGKNLDRNY